jgi:hypothetical protein
LCASAVYFTDLNAEGADLFTISKFVYEMLGYTLGAGTVGKEGFTFIITKSEAIWRERRKRRID